MPVAAVIPPGVGCLIASGVDEDEGWNFEVRLNCFALIAT
jgi:hypothetical protein